MESEMVNRAGKRVIVIGAGIVGASLVYHLAGKGANVTLVEAEDIASGGDGNLICMDQCLRQRT